MLFERHNHLYIPCATNLLIFASGKLSKGERDDLRMGLRQNIRSLYNYNVTDCCALRHMISITLIQILMFYYLPAHIYAAISLSGS